MENEKQPEKCPKYLQLIQHNDDKFNACDRRNRDLAKCRSCLTPFCQKPFKVYRNQHKYLACEVKRSHSTNSTRSLPAKATSGLKSKLNKEKDSLSLGKGYVDCITSKSKTSTKSRIPANKIDNQAQQFVKSETKLRPKAIKVSILKTTNKYRKLHNAKALTMDKELTSHAQEWANHLADMNLLETRPSPLYGENITSARRSLFSVDKIMKLWYQEKYNYDYLKPGFDLYTGHFTQMVWRGTKNLGVGVACNNSNIWIVCNYNPPGNISGHFKENVLPRKWLLVKENTKETKNRNSKLNLLKKEKRV